MNHQLYHCVWVTFMWHLENYSALTCRFNNWQSQFLSSGSPGEGQWIVPITLCCGSYDVHKNFLLKNKSETLDIKEFLGCSISKEGDNAACTWIKLNVNQSGFYRVKYDEDLAAKLRSAIEKKNLSETDRFGTFFTLSCPKFVSLMVKERI